MYRNDIIKFTKKAVVFIVLILTLDVFLGGILEYFYFNMKGGEAARATYAMEKADQDVIVFGSSRAMYHYSPDAFENELGLSFYNVGRAGQGILYYYSVLKTILIRSRPKVIILDIKENEFSTGEHAYESLSLLLPYYNRHPELQNIVNLKSPYEEFKAKLNLYRLNSTILQVAMNNFFTRGANHRNGFVPLSEVWRKPIKESVIGNEKIDSTKVNLFEKFIEDSEQANVKVFVFISPSYKIVRDESLSIMTAREICERNKVYFSNHNQNSYFLSNSSLFKDEEHLNKEGAKIYSELVAREVDGNFKHESLRKSSHEL